MSEKIKKTVTIS